MIRVLSVGGSCNHAVDGMQVDSGINENISVATAGNDFPVFGPDGFQRAAAGSAYSDNAMARSAGGIDGIGRLLADRVPLTVHLMVFDFILVDRTEGTKTDVQRYFRNVDAMGAYRIQQLRREMQTGCGGQRHCPAPWRTPSGTGFGLPAAW